MIKATINYLLTINHFVYSHFSNSISHGSSKLVSLRRCAEGALMLPEKPTRQRTVYLITNIGDGSFLSL